MGQLFPCTERRGRRRGEIALRIPCRHEARIVVFLSAYLGDRDAVTEPVGVRVLPAVDHEIQNLAFLEFQVRNGDGLSFVEQIRVSQQSLAGTDDPSADPVALFREVMKLASQFEGTGVGSRPSPDRGFARILAGVAARHIHVEKAHLGVGERLAEPVAEFFRVVVGKGFEPVFRGKVGIGVSRIRIPSRWCRGPPGRPAPFRETRSPSESPRDSHSADRLAGRGAGSVPAGPFPR